MKRVLKFSLPLMIALFFVPSAFAANMYYKEIPGWEESFMSYPTDVEFIESWGVHLVRDSSIVPSGDAAISVNILNGVANGHHANAAQSIELVDGKTYRISGKFFIPGKTWRYSIKIGDRALIAADGALGTNIGSWTDIEHTFVYTAATFNSKQFRLTANSPEGGVMYADDLSVKEVLYEEDGETIAGYGEELLENGDFETDLDWTAPGEVENLKAENLDSAVKLTWENPIDTDLKTIEVYKKSEMGNEWLASVTGTELLIEDLINQQEYTLLLCTKDNWNNMSEGVEITVCPIPDATKLSEPVFTLDDSPCAELSAGTLKAALQIKNNAMPEDYSVELILVLYHDGAVYDMQSAYRTVQPSEFDQPYSDLSVAVSVPEGEGYSAALYIWDSVTGMEALSKAYKPGE